MFFIVWRGWGILTPVLGFLIWLLPLAAAEAVLGHGTYSNVSKPLSVLTALAAAGAIWVVGTTLNGVPGRLLVDPRTGEQVVLRRRHDLFFIPMQWWAIVMVLVAIVGVFAKS